MSSSPSQRRETLIVPRQEAGERLDLFLTRSLAATSRKNVKRALDGGQVFLDGRVERRASFSLSGGERVQITLEGSSPPPPPPILVELYRDDFLLAVDKPSGLPCHPTVGDRPNVLDLLSARLREERRGDPPILIHRLDADTTGVLLFALSPGANYDCARQFAEREVAKVYFALVAGSPADAFTVKNHLKPGRRGRTQAVASGGQTAETSFTTLARGDGYALVEARPRTGRTHQIRVHLADSGFPLLGDLLYGGPPSLKVGGEILTAGRHLLHARSLTLSHPGDGSPLCLSAPLPADFLPFCQSFPPGTPLPPIG